MVDYVFGTVNKAFGNIVEVLFDGRVRLGEYVIVEIGSEEIRGEVIEITNSVAKVQVFESIDGVKVGDKVRFCKDLVEVELGPGLLSSVFDGLQNPLYELLHNCGSLLNRGVVFPGIDRNKVWDFSPLVSVGEVVYPGSCLGVVPESQFSHKIFVPFVCIGEFEVVWISESVRCNVDKVIALLRNSSGKEIDVSLIQKWPIKFSLCFGHKKRPSELIRTGCRVIDTQFPIAKGGTFCMPGPFGAGKTVLQQQIAKYSSVDIVIFAACGERAGEIVELLHEFPILEDPYNRKPLMDRTILLCNTSSMPVAAREGSIYMAVSIGEYYRQMGLNVLVLADSMSRWAQALREISSQLEEIPGDEAFPVYLASRIAELYQRAGVIESVCGIGSLSIGGAVSPAGGNFDEPVTQATLSVVGSFLGLSRDRSNARKYPAVDPLISWSKYEPIVAEIMSKQSPKWGEWVRSALSILKSGDEVLRRMEVVGEEGMSVYDFVTHLKAELYDSVYLQQNSFVEEDAYCSMEKQKFMFELIMEVLSSDFSSFLSHSEARSFFFELTVELKNICLLSLGSENISTSAAKIRKMLANVC